MKLLMFTRKVDKNDALAGFTFNWVKKIGERLERLYVITWQKSDRGDLPENIEIISLPENKFFKILVLQKYLFSVLPKVNGIFCHMNPEYTIFSAPLAKILNKKVVSWYAHGSIGWKARLVEKMADTIITSSPAGFRLSSKKVKILHQGIDTGIFRPAMDIKQDPRITKIITAGRISPTKDYESMIKAIGSLIKQKSLAIRFSIIGDSPLKSQDGYLLNLKNMVKLMGVEQEIEFLGEIPNMDLPRYLQSADIFINLSNTGSLDKAVLEAMASGCLVITSNDAYAKILPPELIAEKDNPGLLAEKIEKIMGLSEEEKNGLKSKLREEVIKNHNLDDLALKIAQQFN